jgi:hypothetical protein
LPTLIGSALFLASIYCFFRDADTLFGLVIFSSIFEASSMTSSGSMSIQPYYVVALMFLIRSFLDNIADSSRKVRFDGRTALLLFGAIGAISAVTLPFIFHGIPISDPKIAEDELLFVHPPLQFGLSNLAQACYLLVNVGVVFAAGNLEQRPAKLGRAFWFTAYFLSALVFLQFICQTLGLPFPYSILQTNPGYAMAEVESGSVASRVVGTFTESSGAGLVLAALAGGVLARLLEGKSRAITIVIALTALAMVRSSSAIAAVAITAIILVLSRPVFRFPWYVRLNRLKNLLWLVVLGAAAVLVIVASPLRDSILAQTVDKSDTVSFIARTTRDLFSLQLALDTHGLGVGLGSNRPSSLLASLVSNVGVLGLVVFLVMYIRILMNPQGENAWVRWASLALFIDMVLADPDINTPFFWVVLALAVRLRSGAPQESASYRLIKNKAPVQNRTAEASG